MLTNRWYGGCGKIQYPFLTGTALHAAYSDWRRGCAAPYLWQGLARGLAPLHRLTIQAFRDHVTMCDDASVEVRRIELLKRRLGRHAATP